MNIVNALITVLVLIFLGALVYLGWNQFSKPKTGQTPSSQLGEVLTPIPSASVTQVPYPTPTYSYSNGTTKGGIKTTPQTGVNLYVFILGGLGLGLSGWYLVNKARLK